MRRRKIEFFKEFLKEELDEKGGVFGVCCRVFVEFWREAYPWQCVAVKRIQFHSDSKSTSVQLIIRQDVKLDDAELAHPFDLAIKYS